MNTQTHVLLALAGLVTALPATFAGRWSATPPAWQRAASLMLTGAVLGALTPDATLFAMVGIAKWQGVPDAVIFGQWYYQPFWQALATVSNSVPLYLAVLAGAWAARHRLPRVAAAFALAFSVAALLHTLTDLPLHHDDGRPHFWPFSRWVFASPVSYWDPAHHGRVWSLVELALAGVLIGACWRALRHPLWRGALVLAAASYAAMAFYWMTVFG